MIGCHCGGRRMPGPAPHGILVLSTVVRRWFVFSIAMTRSMRPSLSKWRRSPASTRLVRHAGMTIEALEANNSTACRRWGRRDGLDRRCSPSIRRRFCRWCISGACSISLHLWVICLIRSFGPSRIGTCCTACAKPTAGRQTPLDAAIRHWRATGARKARSVRRWQRFGNKVEV